MFNTVMIANRGAIATRIIRTLKKLGIQSLAVYHQEDKDSLHVQQADIAVCLGDNSVADTYLNIEKLIQIAKQHQVDAIHPGYGFLSENTEFVSQCEQANIVFIGPTSTQMNLFGLKHLARDAAEQAGVPLVPGSPLLTERNDAIHWANKIGYPIMLKSTAGGGGIGMQACLNQDEMLIAWESVKRLGENYFSNDGVFLEKLIKNARHIEVQIFANGQGQAISLGERDCSAQRRNQKVVEETPAHNLTHDVREQLHNTAERLMASVNYRNAGTVEFIFDHDANAFYFLEVNTRLQVEHGVTEAVWGVDLVDCMIKQAAGEMEDLQAFKAQLTPSGHSIQARIYAENPAQDFLPSSGLLSEVNWPQKDNLRIDTWIESGIQVPALFDPMLAKVITTADDRQTAISELEQALDHSTLYGIQTNKAYVQAILNGPMHQGGQLFTKDLADFKIQTPSFSVLSGGTQTSIQDYPGRQAHWHVGVPPSGPMDSLSFRLANELLGNNLDAAALEITLNGPRLKFHTSCDVALIGAEFDVSLDGSPVAMNQVIHLDANQTLSIGKVKGTGARCYLAVKNGIQCPDYLGSKSTFTLGQFGGHVGRALRTGDVIELANIISNKKTNKETNQKTNTQSSLKTQPVLSANFQQQAKQTFNPEISQLRVIYGPHGAPDFFTETDIKTFFEHTWEVHYNSSRTGVRLIGPKPEWARESGGEAGMHPSNIHDNAYAFGTVDFTGDMPVILGPDGPSLGGFVCPATVISADLWKLGQLKAGSKIQFIPVTHAQAISLEKAQISDIRELSLVAESVSLSKSESEQVTSRGINPAALASPKVHQGKIGNDEVICRLAGDHFLLVELGPLALDIPRRFKVHALMLWLENYKKTHPESGLRELTPGIRSLQIHFDSQVMSLDKLTRLIDQACHYVATTENLTLPSRTVYLPLSWNDEACQLAIEKYMQSVRKDAPWCPSNLEFIRRINGLKDIQAVKDTVFSADYLVMGLGDVYLGAPVATPLDPRHRLVTTKYNPARTWTAENSVGIGGAYMCVYGMEGPGGYQFVGRTSQMWNRYRKTKEFTQPWLLRFFDQIKFYEVSPEELAHIREALPKGQVSLRIEETQFSLNDYQNFLDANQTQMTEFVKARDEAFDEELARWKENGQLTYEVVEPETSQDDEQALAELISAENINAIDSPVSGNVWQCKVEEGQTVKAGDVLMVLESMKMEIEIYASCDGQVRSLLKQQGQSVQSGQALALIELAPVTELA
ncbi:urea carboxylase [Marinomonas sp. SBI22]|uniref:urea carboxylase n=1 Tax=unclassified Marinomonas TaxID=196814 RepID=UPI0007AEFC51|nr:MULTISPECIES: urea carboxylase [unclassified Marinomonas]KZM43727.1 urea carboxylase [Marinomonas sp. SBI22]KZM47289.1 urea carboxylase [Marinomonas sp. SBI8L]